MKRAFFTSLACSSVLAAHAAVQGGIDPITFVGPYDDSGTGFGNILNVLTLQANSSESGSILRVGGSDATTGDATNTSSTRSVAEMTANQINAGNLGVVFNINEPGSSADLTIQTFTMRFYYNSESSFFDVTWNGPMTLTPVNQGTGGAGYLFMIALTATQASDFFADPSNRVGMFVPTGSPITDSGDGPENFYLVPTPGASTVFGLGLLAATRRRR